MIITLITFSRNLTLHGTYFGPSHEDMHKKVESYCLFTQIKRGCLELYETHSASLNRSSVSFRYCNNKKLEFGDELPEVAHFCTLHWNIVVGRYSSFIYIDIFEASKRGSIAIEVFFTSEMFSASGSDLMIAFTTRKTSWRSNCLFIPWYGGVADVPIPLMAVSQVVEIFSWEVEGLEALWVTDETATVRFAVGGTA